MSNSFAAPWTVARQAPLSLALSRQEYCSGFPCPPPWDLPNPGIKSVSLLSPTLAGGVLTLTSARKEEPYQKCGTWERVGLGGGTKRVVRHEGLPWSWLPIQGPAHCGPSDGDVQREKMESSGSETSLVVQQFRLSLPMQGAEVRSLVMELRFCMPYGVAKKKNNPQSSGSPDWFRGPAANVATVFGNIGAGGVALPSMSSTLQLPERYAKYSI